MYSQNVKIGRVIRVGRGWADVTIDHKLRRVNTRPDLLVKVGSHLKIMNELGISLLPTNENRSSNYFQ